MKYESPNTIEIMLTAEFPRVHDMRETIVVSACLISPRTSDPPIKGRVVRRVYTVPYNRHLARLEVLDGLHGALEYLFEDAMLEDEIIQSSSTCVSDCTFTAELKGEPHATT